MNRYDAQAIKAIKALVSFLNLKSIESTRQVEAIFRVASAGRRFRVLKQEEVAAYLADRKRARDLLLDVIAFPHKSAVERRPVLEAIKRLLGTKAHAIAQVDLSGRRPVLRWITTLDGVEATFAYALAVLASDPMARRRVGFCALEACDLFFYNDRQRGGKQQAYCCEKHSSLDRVRRLRRRRQRAAANKPS
jgi:hypothetical protein